MTKSVSKTVRFDPITFLKVRKAAKDLGVCTSVYIHDLVLGSVALIDLEGYA